MISFCQKTKKQKWLLGIVVLSVFALFLLPNLVAQAQTTEEGGYKVLAPLPGTTSGECKQPGDPGCKTDLQTYLPGLFRFAIGVSIAFVLLNLVFGGFQWMSSDAFTKKEEGKKRIENSLKGILLVAGAWLILNTINPSLLDTKLDIQPIDIPAATSTSTSPSVSGLQQSTQIAIDELKRLCPNCVNITSTTGGQHTVGSLHYQGLAIDIAPNENLNKFLVGSTNPPPPCGKINKTLNGKSATFLWEPKGAKCGGTVPSSGDHWHMSVSR